VCVVGSEWPPTRSHIFNFLHPKSCVFLHEFVFRWRMLAWNN
jgi:hypothetical protein